MRMKKTLFAFYSIFLLSLGAFIQTNCGEGTATAQGTVAASGVTFDNTGTGLSATNLQDATAEIAGQSGCIDPATNIIGTWNGSTFSTSTGDIEETTGISWTFNADGTYTSSFTDYPNGKYRVLSCNQMILTTTAMGGFLAATQDFRVTSNSLSMSLENNGAVTVAFLLSKI